MEIAILDTGINTKHLRLKDTVVGGFTLIDSQNGYEDDNGHGTLCASVIKKEAPESRFWSIKVLDSENCSSLEILERALELLADLPIRLIHMSLSVLDDCDNKDLHRLCKVLLQQGKIVVSSLANGRDVSYPACFKEVLGVRGFILESSKSFWFCPQKSISCIVDSNPYLHAELNQDFQLFGKSNSYAAAKMTGIIANILEKKPWLSYMGLQNCLFKMAVRNSWQNTDLCKSKRFPVRSQVEVPILLKRKTQNIICEFLKLPSDVRLDEDNLFSPNIGLTEKNCFLLLKILEREFSFNIPDYTDISRYDLCYLSNLMELILRMVRNES